MFIEIRFSFTSFKFKMSIFGTKLKLATQTKLYVGFYLRGLIIGCGFWITGTGAYNREGLLAGAEGLIGLRYADGDVAQEQCTHPRTSENIKLNR